MIAGHDIVFPAAGDAAGLEACARIVARKWRHARFEDAETGEKYFRLEDIPFGNVRDLLVYANPEAEAAWDADSPDSAENSMLYLIARPEDLTVVVDNPNTTEMHSILGAIRGLLRPYILRTCESVA
jgi:hypothetical protein